MTLNPVKLFALALLAAVVSAAKPKLTGGVVRVTFDGLCFSLSSYITFLMLLLIPFTSTDGDRRRCHSGCVVGGSRDRPPRVLPC